MRPNPINKVFEAARIIATNPVNATRFAIDTFRRRTTPRRMNFRGIPLYVRPHSPDLSMIRFAQLGDLEAGIAHTKIRHGLIIDAGAYIGLAAIKFARAFPEAKIISIEPSSENIALARQNCADYPNIEILHAALGPERGRLQLKDRQTGQWGFTIVEEAADRPDAKIIEEVDVITIEDVLAHAGCDGVDCLKLDIEGGEYALFKERPAWIDRVDLIFAELHDRICPDATRVFEAATQGRLELASGGEKRISVRQG